MSKDFHLLTPTEDQARAGSKPKAVTIPASKETYGSSDGNHRWVDEETLRLVQQIFLLQTQDPPRVVVFAGIDEGNGCSRICATVAEILGLE